MNILRRNSRWQGDEGFTLTMVLFVTMIAVAIGVALVTSVVFTDSTVSLGRETVQARAAAETGLDTALAALEQSSGTALPCTLSGAASGVASGSTQPTYQVTLTYKDAAGAGLGCPPSAAPTSVVITSTGNSYQAFGGAPQHQRQMEAAVQLRAGTASWEANFNKAFFSQSNVITNDYFKLLGTGADFYTNGSFDCRNNSQLDGSVYAQGTGTMTNSCAILGDLWTKGGISTTTPAPSIGGNVKSATGGLSMANNGVKIGGDVFLAGAMSGTPTFQPGHAAHTNLGPGVVGNPPEQAFPHIKYNEADWTAKGWATKTWAQYIADLRNTAPIVTPSWWTDVCTVADQSYSLNRPMVSPATNTVVDARSCPTLLWNVKNELKLRADMTIIATNLNKSNTLNVTSVAADGVTASSTPHTLRVIIPWTDSTFCDATHSIPTTMAFANLTTIDPVVTTFLYTAGNMQLDNQFSVTGQLYGCKITSSTNTTVTFKAVGGPTDDTSNAGVPYRADVLYKRDT